MSEPSAPLIEGPKQEIQYVGLQYQDQVKYCTFISTPCARTAMFDLITIAHIIVCT
jgi:hypothetical protein